MQPKVTPAKADPIKGVCAVTLAAFLAALSLIDPVVTIASIALSAGLLAWPQRRRNVGCNRRGTRRIAPWPVEDVAHRGAIRRCAPIAPYDGTRAEGQIGAQTATGAAMCGWGS
jgi:transposase